MKAKSVSLRRDFSPDEVRGEDTARVHSRKIHSTIRLMKLFINTSDHLRNNSWFLEFYLKVFTNIFNKLFIFLNFLKKVSLDISFKAIDIRFEDYVFRIAENLPYAFVIIFLGIVGTFTLFKITEEQNGTRISAITTKSMTPAISAGSLIVSVRKDNYKVGDIITYKEKNLSTGLDTGRALPHRIIDEKNVDGNIFFITKGDGNEIPDPGQTSKDQILGKVMIILPNIGYLNLIIKTVPGFIIFIMIPVIFIIKNEVNYIKQEVR